MILMIGQATNLLHTRLFDTHVETLLKTLLEFGEFPRATAAARGQWIKWRRRKERGRHLERDSPKISNSGNRTPGLTY
jgi:hypothetical protein